MVKDIYWNAASKVEMIQDKYTTLLNALTEYETTWIILLLFSHTNTVKPLILATLNFGHP